MKPNEKISHLLEKGAAAYKKGDYENAAILYRQALEILPDNADIMNMLSCVTFALGHPEKSFDLIEKAIKINPASPMYRNNLGNFLFSQEKYPEAMLAFEKAVELNPQFMDAHYNLGLAAMRCADLKTALKCFQTCIKNKPDFCDARTNLGKIYVDLGKPKKAFPHFKKALDLNPSDMTTNVNFSIALDKSGKHEQAMALLENALSFHPGHPEILYNLGNFYQKSEQTKQAIASFEKALETTPNDIRILYNLGTTLMEAGERLKALPILESVLVHSPNDPKTLNNMGLIHYYIGEYKKSVPFFEKAIANRSGFFKAYNNMGLAFKALEKLNDAMTCFQKATEIAPHFAEAFHNLSEMQREAGDFESAAVNCRKALSLEPDLPQANTHYAYLLKWQCDWQEFDRISKNMDKLILRQLEKGDPVGETPFMNIIRKDDPAFNRRVTDAFAQKTMKNVAHLNVHFSHDEKKRFVSSEMLNGSLSDRKKDANTKIIVGYLSANFKNHPMAHLLADLFKFHNRNQFQINAYSLGPDDGSDYRKRFIDNADIFRDIRHFSHEMAANQIYRDGVDILVDLMGYTQGNRMEIAALRPAPIQVRYMGLAGTTGGNLFDYIIVDEIVTPRDQQNNYAETFIYMPHTYQINDRNKTISQTPVTRKMFNLPDNAFVFCSFNQSYKIDPEIFNIWLDILKQVDNSVLWLMPGRNTGASTRLAAIAEEYGVAPHRLIFTESIPLSKHLARLKLADLALDTRTIGGAATTSDALYAGIPVITLLGNRFASRMSASILSAIGLTELIAKNLDEYRTLAIRLAQNPEELNSILQKLKNNFHSAPLFDTYGFTLNLEKAYLKIYENFCNGKAPQLIDLKENILDVLTAPSLFSHQYGSAISHIAMN